VDPKDTRFEKVSLVRVCDLEGGFEEVLGNGDDRPEVGGVGRKAAKAGAGPA
jgi:hypothetical protein